MDEVRFKFFSDKTAKGEGLEILEAELLLNEVESLKSKLSAAESKLRSLDGQGWRPIEEAPKDGTKILVTSRLTGPEIVFFQADCWWKQLPSEVFPAWTQFPTHWMPLPSPPKGEW